VRAEDVKGRAAIETSLNPIEVRRVGGEARLKAEHGAITASDVDGPLTAEGTFEDMTLARVGGPVDVRVSHASLSASELPRGGRVSALGGEVRVHRFAGALEVQAERATVDLLPAGALADAVVARTTFGDIRLGVPEGSRMLLEAAATNGDVTVDVPGLAVTREPGGRTTGTMSGGTNAVRLFAEHGSVEVGSALAAAAAARTREEAEEGSPRR
jgi:hypothetical protein